MADASGFLNVPSQNDELSQKIIGSKELSLDAIEVTRFHENKRNKRSDEDGYYLLIVNFRMTAANTARLDLKHHNQLTDRQGSTARWTQGFLISNFGNLGDFKTPQIGANDWSPRALADSKPSRAREQASSVLARSNLVKFVVDSQY
jgi:hypothetical protein